MTTGAEFSLARKALLAVVIPVALLAAVVAQMSVVNRLPLPAGVVPDLVLLLVASVAVTTTPVTGALAGFAGGLALDIAPPATHYAGEYALVFCLTGYAAARAMAAVTAAAGERSFTTALTIVATAAASGEAGKAVLGLLLSDPAATGAAISRLLPGAILADLLLSPFALWPAWRVARPGEPERAPRPQFAGAQRIASAFRLASSGAAPDLRLAGRGTLRPGPQPPPRREPRLRLAGARSPALARTSAASSPAARPLLAGGRTTRLKFAGSGESFRATGNVRPGARLRPGAFRSGASFSTGGGALGPSLFPGMAIRPQARPSKGWLRQERQPAATLAGPARRGSPGRGWLRARGPAAFAGPVGRARRPRVPRFASPARFPGRPGLPGTRQPARAPKFSGAARFPDAARFRGGAGAAGAPGATAPRRAGQRGGPGKGWLRGSSLAPPPAARRGPGRGWLRASRPPRRSWQASVPSRRWLRRSRARSRWRALGRRLHLSRFMDLMPKGGRR